MRQTQPTKVTGLNLYLALSKLDLFLTHGEGALPLPDAQLAAAVVHYDLACVADFRTQSGEHLCSELFTAKAVGELIVRLAIEEGVVVPDVEHSLAVRLHQEVSPALGMMLMSFNRCLGACWAFWRACRGALRSRTRRPERASCARPPAGYVCRLDLPRMLR